VSLAPPSSGTYQGILLFQDRSVTQPLYLTGNGTSTIGGTVYAPSALVVLTANTWDDGSADTLGGAYVCSTVLVWGAGNINIDPGNLALQIPELALAE
jgi:hypothetical protein